jgi:flagellar protein FliO/FliZ
MFDTLFGGGQYALKMLFAFIVVFGLLALALWLVRRFSGERLSSAATRGRQPRLAVIDAATVDGRRRLLLIRRDNVEHLLMIGGPTDVVVEQNIVRAATGQREARDMPRELARPAPASDALPRAVPLGEGNMWPLQPEPATRPEPARSEPRSEPRSESRPLEPRPQRTPPPPVAEEEPQWAAPEREPLPPPAPPPRERRPRPDPLSGLADELGRAPPAPEPVRFEPPARPATRREARPRPQPPAASAPAVAPVVAPAAKFTPSADQNLAEMAQRLEAALRRPNTRVEERAPAPSPKVEPRLPEPVAEEAAEPIAVPEGSASPASAANEPSAPARGDERPARTDSKPAPQRSLYDSLEQEMASLLGRPGNK